MLTDRRTLLKLALFGLACSGSPVRAAGERQTKLSDDALQAAAETSNLFAADLQKLLGTEGGNLFFSPASISAALAMTAAGAEGETRKEMFSVLHASGESDAWLRGMGGLSRLLNATGEGYTLQMANRLWGQNGFQFRADYLLRMEEQFAAPLGQVDFVGAPEPSREAIESRTCSPQGASPA
jgi:serpin B